MKPVALPIKIAFSSAALLFSACLFQTERPAGPAPSAAKGEGQAELSVKLGPVGALAKSAASAGASAAQAIELSALYITLTAEAETPRRDTIPLSGSGANTVSRGYSGLAAGKTWNVEAHTVDSRGRTIHTGYAAFSLQPGRTTAVALDMPAYYSMLTARFFPIDDSVTRCQLVVDAGIVADTTFPKQSLVGDTVQLEYDYLSVGPRRVAMNVYGEYDGAAILLYSGDTLINVQAGLDARYDIRLIWRGPGVFRGTAAMTVSLGAAGKVDVNGRLLTSKNQDPVFISTEADLQNGGAPEVAYLDTVHAIDPDGDSITYSLLAGPTDMVLTDSILAWTPDSTDANQTVSVLAQDGKGGRDTLSWNITLYPSVLGGIISSDMVLERANSPYWVIGNVLVREGVRMSIEPGVRVVFGDAKGIQINGTLVARGTESDSIVFTSEEPVTVKWARILFADSSADAVLDAEGNYLSGSVLEYCRIEQGGKGVSAEVQMENASPFIHRSWIAFSESRGIAALGTSVIAECDIVRNEGGGIGFTGPWPWQSALRGQIRANRIDSNATLADINWHSGGGILLQGAVDVVDNVITRNGSTARTTGGGLYVECCGGARTISGNRIEGNRGLDYGAGQFSGDTLVNNIFRGNTNRWGAVIDANSSHLSGNIIEGNVQVQPSGNNINYPVIILRSTTFVRNTVRDNRTMDQMAGAVQISWGSNPVTGNNFLNPDLAYELTNSNSSTSPNVDASGNWWGTADEMQIQGRIFDWFDDASKGIVGYTPFLTAPAEGAPAP